MKYLEGVASASSFLVTGPSHSSSRKGRRRRKRRRAVSRVRSRKFQVCSEPGPSAYFTVNADIGGPICDSTDFNLASDPLSEFAGSGPFSYSRESASRRSVFGHRQCLITAMTCASLLMPVVAAHSQTQSIDDTTGPQLALRMGHSSSVVAVAMSPDAHLLATGSFDRTIRLWDVNTKNEIRVLQETAAVTSVLFFDDTHLITGTSNGVLRVWDVRDGSNVISTELDSGIKSIGLSPSALELWVATTLGGISVLSVATLEPKPHANPILPLLLPAYLGVSISRSITRMERTQSCFGTRSALYFGVGTHDLGESSLATANWTTPSARRFSYPTD